MEAAWQRELHTLRCSLACGELLLVPPHFATQMRELRISAVAWRRELRAWRCYLACGELTSSAVLPPSSTIQMRELRI